MLCLVESAIDALTHMQKLCHYENCLVFACYYGLYDIADLMIRNGARNYNAGLRAAYECGDRDMVEFMIDRGAQEMHDLNILLLWRDT